MNKTLYELSLEYDQSIRLTEDIIKKTLAERKNAVAQGDTDKVMYLSAKLKALYEEKRDMKIISEKLKKYYDTEDIHFENRLFSETGGCDDFKQAYCS